MPPELSRPVVLAQVPEAGRDLVIEASPAECAALAARLGIEAVNRLRASLRLAPGPEGVILGRGGLSAEVIQACVVTLEPVTQEVSAPLSLRLLPAGMEPLDTPADEADDIESVNGSVDLGEVVAEELALALDPYPRAPGAELPPEATEGADNPFAALAALKARPPSH